MLVRAVGVGQRAAGDDGAGPAVIDVLRGEGETSALGLHEVREPSALLPLLEEVDRVIVIDAALTDAHEPGDLLLLSPEEIDTHALAPVSTHGMSVGQAIALARVLSPEAVCRDIRLVAIVAERPRGLVFGLSEKVAAAIFRAAEVVRKIAAEQAI